MLFSCTEFLIGLFLQSQNNESRNCGISPLFGGTLSEEFHELLQVSLFTQMTYGTW